MNILKKSVLATTLAASAIVASASPAVARDRFRDRDDTAAIAIGAGVVGLALGAIVASSSRDRARDGRYYDNRRYVNDGRYYDRAPRYQSRDWQYRDNRYYRDDRYYQGYRDPYYGRRGY